MSITNQKTPKLIALLGGTFDPIHLGHILPAQETAHWLGAKQLHLIPAHIPPHKTSTHANAKQRAKMVALVCDESQLFTLDDRELKRQSRSYTVDTLQQIKAEQPKADLYFIMGMDSLLSFTKWHRWQDILTLCNLVVNIRPGYPHLALEAALEPALTSRLIYSLAQLQRRQTGQILIHESSPVDISSTTIRAKIKAGLNASQYLPQCVHDYIEQHKLYQ
ncbi:nicotinate-nucleotide adenylyltransferase [Colwellia sp. C1TZA3]|uniref:nicotinate-nucleotide adenylyltransferase n=1 Tax=Colwellia sp. C1TZA3 TaxID=2508879 RepID=UPI0011BA025B|nr:nicotinate-nucleotide adenylyltransferase [Colwellia sp. C1TZA3]TWX73107.1 nicotinate-nucleotide adenylyltransferase [Colwellia sp. C1TZA3]